MEEIKRNEIKITGIVQGVGFRPFIYTLAKSLSLNGWVNNTSNGVVIDVEGEGDTLDIFLNRIEKEAPALSRIKSIIRENAIPVGYSDFLIKESTRTDESNIYISPDECVCKDCERELFDSNNRRFLYPFINCTNCGPRFTIVKGVPYDRPNTTMSKFQMCDKCKSEYEEPADRRYHAQPISCFECGPRLSLLDNKGKAVIDDGESSTDIIGCCNKLILQGKIVGVKGIGGYHLVCDATNIKAVKELRARKARDEKPFAIMVKDTDTALKYCYMGVEEKELLESGQRPIVLLKKREDGKLPLEIAPGNPFLGVMLPYTPLHMLFFHNSGIEGLIMTSGNRSSEPIYYKDEEAFENLNNIADFFLTNDREIFIRTDDSVTRVFKEKEYIIRRSRGYVPMPITIETAYDNCSIQKENKQFYDEEKSLKSIPSVLACGGELKNTFCMNRGEEFFISHHIGDLENSETLTSFEEGIEHFKKLFNIEYETIAYDLHPEYLSTKYAISSNIKNKIAVQHHHAHIASCMAEHNLNEDVIGVAFDGTGYGEDGNLWGGEFFTGSYNDFKRAAHLKYVKMPGGEMAVKEPWRMALSYLYEMKELLQLEVCSDYGIMINNKLYLDGIENGKIKTVMQMMDKNLNSPLTSSMGRLFDAVSALLGIKYKISYEGQAAIELEYIADKNQKESYGFTVWVKNDIIQIDARNVIYGIIEDMKNNIAISVISGKFHETIAFIVFEVCSRIREDKGLEKIVLSGGVFQNITLLSKCVKKLKEAGFIVYIHSKVPSNDGGISLGQAVIALSQERKA